MGSAVGLRGEFPALELRALARRSADAAQLRRLLALAVIYADGTRMARGGRAAWGCRRRWVADCARPRVAVQRAGPGGADWLI